MIKDYCLAIKEMRSTGSSMPIERNMRVPSCKEMDSPIKQVVGEMFAWEMPDLDLFPVGRYLFMAKDGFNVKLLHQ